MKTVSKQQYFTGGLAEIVACPSIVTYGFLSRWFTGKNSIGLAMKLLGLPHEAVADSLVALHQGTLVVDLELEQQTLYQNTLLKYGKQHSLESTPKLQFNGWAVFNPLAWFKTFQLIIKQGHWIAQPTEFVAQAHKWADEIPDVFDSTSLEIVDEYLQDIVWPKVIAVDVLAEFYNQFLVQECKDTYPDVLAFSSQEMAKKDWFFQSLIEQYRVKDGSLSLDEYLAMYGDRADRDFEITCPRWSEITSTLQQRIKKLGAMPPQKRADMDLSFLSPQLRSVLQAFTELQLIRSEVRRKALAAFKQLRQYVVQEFQGQTLKLEQPLKKSSQASVSVSHGQGRGVSKGNVAGSVPDEIGVFPNASPEFAHLYPQCKGMMFLSGGQTSHGAVVAREFGIPALIDAQAAYISVGDEVEMDGATGVWKVLTKNAQTSISEAQIISLQKLGKEDSSKVGGKAANLGELLSQGFSVPDGFVVVFPQLHINEKSDISFSEGVVAQLQEAFDSLQTPLVAVRSSAVGEDGATTSFAGQFKTVLGVTKETLLEAVASCLESFDAETAKDYAHHRGVTLEKKHMSVCVQTLVPADVSGVLFTKNVVTGNTDEITLEAVSGLGESLAQGEVNPEQFLVHKQTGEVISRTTAQQMWTYKAAADGIQKTPKTSNEHLVTPDKVHELCEVAKRIEKHFGTPQDIEWAIAEGKVYILQSRPITA